MEQPEGYRTGDPIKTACKLNESLYGLKQSSRTWNTKFRELIVKMNFIRNVADPCVYHRKDSNGTTILAIWVDDGLLCGPGRKQLNEIIDKQRKSIEVPISAAIFFLGIKLTRNRSARSVHLSQEITRLITRYGMQDCKNTRPSTEKQWGALCM